MKAQSEEEAMARLLSQRFGDGLVYLTDNGDRKRLERAKRRGLVADDGYLTPRGLALAHRQEECVFQEPSRGTSAERMQPANSTSPGS